MKICSKDYLVFQVSILVLLDLVVGQFIQTSSGTPRNKFQSLFCWIWWLDFRPESDITNYSEFQSLFCWIWWLDKTSTTFLWHLVVFQSLFCWIWWLDTIDSNLQDGGFPFQSLFCWIWWLDTSFFIIFTPYHQVSILVLLDLVVGPIILFSGPINHLFQSLFCWIWWLDCSV